MTDWCDYQVPGLLEEKFKRDAKEGEESSSTKANDDGNLVQKSWI